MPRCRLPALPLHALRAFESAFRLGSFKGAASELGVTPAAISHQIKSLEAQLGLLLFERLHRSLRITLAGKRLGEAAGVAFSGLERALDELSDHGLVAGARSLSVTAAPSLAGKWLAPRIHRFQTLHPTIDLRLLAGNELADLTDRRELDVALRYGRGPYGPELHAQRLWPSGEIVVVCAPSVAVNGVLREPSDLLNFSLLRTATPRPPDQPQATARPVGWGAWLAAADVTGEAADRAAVSGPLFGSTQLALEAATAGRGIALAPLVLVEEDLRAARLVRPFPAAIADPNCYWLLYRRDRADEARIRAFTRWILDEAASTPVGGLE